MKKAYKAKLLNGCMTIIRAKSIDKAREFAMKEFGRELSPVVTKAKDDEVSWCELMGGFIHEV